MSALPQGGQPLRRTARSRANPFPKEDLMAGKTEHAQPPAVVRVIELVGVSDKSWSDAAQQAVARAAQTLRHIAGVDVVKSSAVVKNNKIAEYHVNVKLAFIVEGPEIEHP
jgi:flavin-binding protein dodecin